MKEHALVSIGNLTVAGSRQTTAWDKKNVSNSKKNQLTAEGLWHFACRYVARYACSRQQLARYLKRKIEQNTGLGEIENPAREVEKIIVRLVALGALDENTLMQNLITRDKQRSYGARRTRQRLQQRGVAADVMATLEPQTPQEALQLAIRFAQRRKLGPFADLPVSEQKTQARIKEKARAQRAMLTAGHSYDVVVQVLEASDAQALLDHLESDADI
jgi:regulatory protein